MVATWSGRKGKGNDDFFPGGHSTNQFRKATETSIFYVPYSRNIWPKAIALRFPTDGAPPRETIPA